MRRLIVILLLLAVCVAALGYYRGWFTVKTTTDPDTGKQGVGFEMEKSKITSDIDKVKEKIGSEGAKTSDKPQEK